MSADTMTREEYAETLATRFGPDPMKWAVVCPACDERITGLDYREALNDRPRTNRDGSPQTASDVFGQQCIGRLLGILGGPVEDWTGRGCDWAAFGLFRGPLIITLPDGGEMGAFRPAES